MIFCNTCIILTNLFQVKVFVIEDCQKSDYKVQPCVPSVNYYCSIKVLLKIRIKTHVTTAKTILCKYVILKIKLIFRPKRVSLKTKTKSSAQKKYRKGPNVEKIMKHCTKTQKY